MLKSFRVALGLVESEAEAKRKRIAITNQPCDAGDVTAAASPISRLQELDFDFGVCIIAKGRLSRSVLEPWYAFKVKTSEIELTGEENVAMVKKTCRGRGGRPIAVIVQVATEAGLRAIPSVITCLPSVQNNHFIIDSGAADFDLVFAELTKCLFDACARYEMWLNEELKDVVLN